MPARPEIQKHKHPANESKQKQEPRTTVRFDLNSARISPIEAKKLKKFASNARRHGCSVHVAGYTCWLGSKELNERLALARAMAVVHALGKYDVKVGSLTARGKCCYIDPVHAAPNRRVELTCTKKAQKGGDRGL